MAAVSFHDKNDTGRRPRDRHRPLGQPGEFAIEPDLQYRAAPPDG